jgi:hypothetical protein
MPKRTIPKQITPLTYIFTVFQGYSGYNVYAFMVYGITYLKIVYLINFRFRVYCKNYYFYITY